MFFRSNRDILLTIERELRIMALNFAPLQAAVTQLSADVQTLITQSQSGSPADQATVDAVTASLAALDTAVKTAESSGSTGATGATGPATGSTGPTGA